MYQNYTRADLADIKLFLLDMDGTVYLGEKWIDGARAFLDAVLASGRRYAFLTNNASRDTGAYLEKLRRMGLELPAKYLVTSGHATARYLNEHFRDKRVFVLGTDAFKSELTGFGVDVSAACPGVVVVSFHTELTYSDLAETCALVRSGLPYIATHPDLNCPTEAGFIPDAGANMAFVHASTGRWPDVIIGKPQRGIVDFALEKLGASASEAAMVGDRLYTDIAAGNNAGITSVLVLSGETGVEDLAASDIKPDFVFGSVKDIIPLL